MAVVVVAVIAMYDVCLFFISRFNIQVYDRMIDDTCRLESVHYIIINYDVHVYIHT